jgi:hypothetical protein
VGSIPRVSHYFWTKQFLVIITHHNIPLNYWTMWSDLSHFKPSEQLIESLQYWTRNISTVYSLHFKSHSYSSSLQLIGSSDILLVLFLFWSATSMSLGTRKVHSISHSTSLKQLHSIHTNSSTHCMQGVQCMLALMMIALLLEMMFTPEMISKPETPLGQ